MKNLILIVLSIVVYIASMFVNMGIVIDGQINLLNLAVSLVFFAFWIAFLMMSRRSKKMMIYCISVWAVILATTILTLVSSFAKFFMGPANMLIVLFLTPVYGIRYFEGGPMIILLIIALIAAIFIGFSILFIKKSKAVY